MNHLRRAGAIASLVITVFAQSLALAPATLGATNVAIEVNGSASSQAISVGTTLTATATISGVSPIADCFWTLQFVGWANGDSYSSTTQVDLRPEGGHCPSLVTRLPNIGDLVATMPLNASQVGISLNVNFVDLSHRSSNGVRITFPISSSHPTATSNYPMLLWTLSDTKPAAGQTVAMRFYGVGLPDDWDPQAADPQEGVSEPGDWHLGFRCTNPAHSGTCTSNVMLDDPLHSFSFAEPSTGERVIAQINRVGMDRQSVFGAYADVQVMDPPELDETPDPTPVPEFLVWLEATQDEPDPNAEVRHVLITAEPEGGIGPYSASWDIPGEDNPYVSSDLVLESDVDCGDLPATLTMTLTDSVGATTSGEVEIEDCDLATDAPATPKPTHKPKPSHNPKPNSTARPTAKTTMPPTDTAPSDPVTGARPTPPAVLVAPDTSVATANPLSSAVAADLSVAAPPTASVGNKTTPTPTTDGSNEVWSWFLVLVGLIVFVLVAWKRRARDEHAPGAPPR